MIVKTVSQSVEVLDFTCTWGVVFYNRGRAIDGYYFER
jgi:hypothetical protein